MIVVVDTNLWLKELALNTAIGSAFRFFLKHRGATLAVPEVVRLEVQQNLKTLIQDAIDDVEKGNRQLLALFGSMKEVVLPTPDAVEILVSGVFAGLGVEILDIPFSLESARASFLKTVQKVSPSDKTQEFKDGVVWADCVRLLESDDVLLATLDKAFYAYRDYGKGLADNLAHEIADKPRSLRITDSIAKVLDQIRTPVAVNKATFVLAVREGAHRAADELLSRVGASISGEPVLHQDLFATENPDVLYFKHRITLPCIDAAGGGRTDMQLILTGDGSLKPESGELIEVHVGEETLVFKNKDGNADRVRNIYMSGNSFLGHRTIEHSVRHPLAENP